MHNKLMVLYVLDMAQTHNPNIGKYLRHAKTENNGYTVILNNGSLEIPEDLVKDMDLHRIEISEDRVAPIAMSFRERVSL
jgi:hypothetical protein